MAELVLISKLIHLKGQKGCVGMTTIFFIFLNMCAHIKKKTVAFSHTTRNTKQTRCTETCGHTG